MGVVTGRPWLISYMSIVEGREWQMKGLSNYVISLHYFMEQQFSLKVIPIFL